MITFAKFTDEERLIVHRIAKRAALLTGYSLMDHSMDISVVHAHTPLRLAELADADDFNFAHDICGISHHLNRNTGELEDCFVPRFALPETAVQSSAVDEAHEDDRIDPTRWNL